jgi:hypothetical protein
MMELDHNHHLGVAYMDGVYKLSFKLEVVGAV